MSEFAKKYNFILNLFERGQPFCYVVLLVIFILVRSLNSFAQSEDAVELNGDQIEFMRETNKVIAKGNVVIIKGNVKLTCDKVEFAKDTSLASAEGHVVLSSPQGTISGDKMVYNFDKMTGDFMGARLDSDPYYGAAQKMSKLGENHIQMSNGYLTTCDHDKPHFRFLSSKLDIYPGEKAVARNVRMVVGKVPLMFIPRFSQVINDKKPRVIYTPGYDKDWGAFLLQKWRYYFNEDFKGTIHLDYRERKDFAWGIDTDYKLRNMGSGVIRTYYMNERNITSKHFYQPRPSPTIEKERFKAEWRHKWTINDKTEAILQYYKLSDPGILKDYFEREYEKDQNPETFFLLTRTLTNGTLSFRTDKRVNRFVSTVERLPEIQYNLPSQKIGPTNFYLKNINTFSNLSLKAPSPTEVRKETMRFDTEDEISYPFKVGFVEMRPFVAGRETFYSKTKDPSQYNVVRGVFTTGSDLSTKFYKIYDVKRKIMGIEINRLRHIITPSIAYKYQTNPTISSDQLDNFDRIDTILRDHTVGFSLENKLQTKRDGKNVDLLRGILSSDFRLKEYPGAGGFDHVKTDIEFKPADWLIFYSDTDYDTNQDHLSSANFDLYLNEGDKWSFGLGKRYNVEVDDQITTDLKYRFNPKWAFRFYQRFDIDGGLLKEQEYTLTRDLHEWEMDINFNQTRGEGSEIWLVFRLKAFPDMTIDMGSSFNKRKAGSQSSEGN